MKKSGEKRWKNTCLASLGVQSTIKYARHGCTRRASDLQYLADNVLNRQFYADKPNEKWLTDVTEFKYYVGSSVQAWGEPRNWRTRLAMTSLCR